MGNRLSKIYTRTGDDGTTGLYGGTRVPKSSLRMHAYGTIDELNACLGVLLSMQTIPEPVRGQLENVQQMLFEVGADLATPLESRAKVMRMSPAPATAMEQWIDGLEEELSPLTQFIFPSGSVMGAELHRARTVCRRAERWIVELAATEPVTPDVIVYVNRLSDYLFVAARFVNKHLQSPERTVVIPKPATAPQTAKKN